MIDSSKHPVAWAQFLFELEDAHEHLGDLIANLKTRGPQSDGEFSVHIGHVFAHLNRAWHSRNQLQEISEEQWPHYSAFPTDLDPVG